MGSSNLKTKEEGMNRKITFLVLLGIHHGSPKEDCCSRVTLEPKDSSNPRIYKLVEGDTGSKMRPYNCVSDCYYIEEGDDQKKQVCFTQGSSYKGSCTPASKPPVEVGCCETVTVEGAADIQGDYTKQDNTHYKLDSKTLKFRASGGYWVFNDGTQDLHSVESSAKCPNELSGDWDLMGTHPTKVPLTLKCKEG